MGRKKSKIPDRWMNYDPIKDTIKDIRIVPFKTPLGIKIFETDSLKNHKWTPSDVMQYVPDLGLVIDLTFKQPAYYDPVEFLENGIDYMKIACPGHINPTKEIFDKFCDTIEAFLQEHPNLVVGIHCTHGVNRTGYMICRYMVERLGYSAKDALETFASRRGYPVERDNYLQEIHNSFKSEGHDIIVLNTSSE